MKVIIAPDVCGFELNRACLDELFQRRPELFDEPLPANELRLAGQTDAELLHLHAGAVLRDGQLHFLLEKDSRLRTDSVLLALLASEGDSKIRGEGCALLKIVEVPDDVKWYIRIEDNGAESIHEAHRVGDSV